MVGVVCLEQTDDIRHWSEDEANFVATLSDFATIALLSHHKDVAETALIQAQKMESLGRLAGGIAHDFNNILTVITGAVDTLQVKWDVEKGQQRLLELIAEASERARKVTRNLLAFGGQQNLTLETFDTRSLLDAVNDLTSSIIREDIQVTFDNTDKNYWINGDQTQLEQVLLNLMINSIDAMPQGGAINVEVLPPDHKMQIGFAVTDTGSGISERIKDKIFEPFFTTKGAFGSGLGLSISLGIMQQHSGSLRCVQSGPQGSRFEIRLPRVGDPQQQSQSIAPEETPEQPTPSLVILLVEDEPSVRDIVTQMLTVIGYDILVAQDPEDALALLQDNTVGLLISDVVMPGMRGPDLYEEARKHMPTLPALFVSGYSEEIVADLPGEPSQVGYLSKPFTLKQLRGAIDELVPRSA